jgi:hypothetical protein
MKSVRLAHNLSRALWSYDWNSGMMEDWNNGFWPPTRRVCGSERKMELWQCIAIFSIIKTKNGKNPFLKQYSSIPVFHYSSYSNKRISL